MSAGNPKKRKKSTVIQEQPPVKSSKYLALSFAFPVIILGTVFALSEVYPFGDKQITIYDFWHQYYPFLSNLWYKLREGAVSAWSWSAGAGHDYTALIAYYMASPLNLLAMIFPHEWLCETLTIVLLIKIGLTGLFTTLFFRYTFKQTILNVRQTGMAQAVFSSLYALCAFTLGYFWNIMWFDSFALLPLVALGLLALMREGKWRLYVTSLSFAVFTNFYIGLIICMFVAIAFFSICIIKKIKMRELLSKLGLVAGCSALAIGMTAVLLLPTWSCLQFIDSTANVFPSEILLYDSFFSVLGNFIAFNWPTVLIGLPNVYCGMICILLAGVYMASSAVVLREKMTLAVILVFLIISCNLNVLNYIMHGFRHPTSIPSRFSFLISFILVIIAYRAFLLTESMPRQHSALRGQSDRSLLAMGISAAVFLLAAVFGIQEKNAIIGSAILCVVYLLIFFASMADKTAKRRLVIQAALFLVIFTEIFITSLTDKKIVSRDDFFNGHEQIQELLDLRQPSGNDFYRTDIDGLRNFNEAALFNCNGISFFSSTANSDLTRFMSGLGLTVMSADYRYWFTATSPLTSTFLNMRYYISRYGDPADNSVYWETVGEAGDSELLENKYRLPLGFMVNEDIVGYKHHDSNPFLSQNDLFKRTTGIDARLFATMDITEKAEPSGEKTMWHIGVLSDGPLYVFCKLEEDMDMIEIYVNGDLIRSRPLAFATPYIFTAGCFSQGDVVSFSLKTDDVSLIVGSLNQRLFDYGYVQLLDEPFEISEFTETKVRGTVTALQNGILYTSIPGINWQVYVDGVKRELLLIDKVMAAVRLSEGTHEVEFRYVNKSLTAGTIISLVSLVVFIILIILDMLKHRKSEKNESAEA